MEGKEKKNRLSVNAINLFVTCLFLFFAVQFSNGAGGFTSTINSITANLDRDFLGLDDNVTYTDYRDTSVYVSCTNFYAKGMAGLYNLTTMFIDIIVPKDILMDGIIDIGANNNINVNIPDPTDTLYYYRKLVAIVLFLVLCVLLFPLCGLCFCCCRCCGKCGGRSQPADKKKDTCKKIIQGTLLIVLGTGLLFCVVCAFGSNQQLQDGIESFPHSVKNSLTDTKTYFNSTNGQVRHLLVNNYEEFANAFDKTMNDSSDIVTKHLNSYSNATAMTELYNFTTNIDTVNETLNSLKENSNKLRVYASQLNDALRKVKRDLLNTLNFCNTEECGAIKTNISTLSTSIDFNSLPDVTDDIDKFKALDIKNIKSAAEQGNNQLKNIETTIRGALDKGLDSARKQINDTGKIIRENLNSVTNTINEITAQIDTSASPAVDKAQEYINEYGKYRYYIGLAISCVLLLVTICIALGLICGICGKRPDGYSDNCCNKGAGSQFLLCSVMIMFMFGFVISVITIVSMLVGVVSEKAICDPIRNPDPNEFRIIKLLDSFDLIRDIDIKPSVVLNSCYRNESAYITFNLKSQFDLDDIKSQFNITEQLNQLNVNGSIFKNFTILDDGSLQVLLGLLDFTPTANLEQFREELKDNFTNYSLKELSNRLEYIISTLDDVNYGDVKASLRLSVLHLNTYNEKLLLPMKALADEVVNNALKLDEDLKMGKGSFEEAITGLIEEIQSAEKFLRTDGPQALTQVVEQFKKVVENQINSYIDRVYDHIRDKIGLCGPLSQAVNSTMTATCKKVILPWNGFWFSLFWSTILYVMVIVISVKLANLYQKYKPYGQYVETEYLYDAYADRGDSIPLNSRAKRGKKKGKKSKRYEERPNVGSEVAREFAAGSHPPDARYADMAPKHWEEFPNGGPPQYQRAPTEYERPPPYYYPGSGGEQ